MNRLRVTTALVAAIGVLVLATTASAQSVEGQLSAYTGANAREYLRPLHEAIGVTLNNGFFYTAQIPDKFKFALEIPVMGVIFDDADRVFAATTEAPFLPEKTTTKAPTIVGSGDAVSVTGQGSTTFSFPGGFNLNSFGLLVPQARISARGTEALVRLLVGVDTGDAELGKLDLWGVGARHDVSQYFGELPINLAASFFYQSLSLGENTAGNDLLSVSAYSAGLHASAGLPVGFARFEPYAGVAYNSFNTDIEYESSTGSEVLSVDFEQESNMHFTIGAGVNLVALQLFGQFDFGLRDSFLFGVALGNVGL